MALARFGIEATARSIASQGNAFAMRRQRDLYALAETTPEALAHKARRSISDQMKKSKGLRSGEYFGKRSGHNPTSSLAALPFLDLYPVGSLPSRSV